MIIKILLGIICLAQAKGKRSTSKCDQKDLPLQPFSTWDCSGTPETCEQICDFGFTRSDKRRWKNKVTCKTNKKGVAKWRPKSLPRCVPIFESCDDEVPSHTELRMKLVSSEVINQHDGKIISDKPEKNAIRSAFAGTISIAESEASNEWVMHVFFETNIENINFIVSHAGVARQSGSTLTLTSRGWNGDISTVTDILIIGTSNEQINLSGDSRVALFKEKYFNSECIELGPEPEISDETECECPETQECPEHVCPEVEECPEPACPDPNQDEGGDDGENGSDNGTNNGSDEGGANDEGESESGEGNESNDDNNETEGGDDSGNETDGGDDSGNETEDVSEPEDKCTDHPSCGLKQHNKYRKMHGSPALSLDDDLNAAALVFAQELARKNEFYHDPNLQTVGHGENLYASWTSNPSAAVIDYAVAVDEWYSEVSDYDFATGGYQSGTGHFTQVVWKGSTKLGVAHAASSDGWIYFVARYTPSGNWIGEFDENVLPLGTDPNDGDSDDNEENSTDGNTDENTAGNTGGNTDDGTDSGNEDCSGFACHQQAGLDKHNELRALHGSPSMTLSDDLNIAATEWAEHIASLGSMMHDPDLQTLGHGENIYYAWSSNGPEVNYENAIEAWYNEINDSGYDFNNPGWTPGAGHFTQVVWKKSTELGMGHAIADDGSVFIVARYSPSGNWMGEFAENVLPLGTDPNDDDSEDNEDNSTDNNTNDNTADTVDNADNGSDSGNEDCSGVSCHQQTGLAKHNELRALHGSPSMTLSDDLNIAAMEWAEHIASQGSMMHDPNLQTIGHGENIYYAWSSNGPDVNYENAVEAWYNEINDPGYDFSNPGWTPGAGHFTQVVWKKSTELGMGHAIADDGSVFIVARYVSAGNYMSQFAENVPNLLN